MAAQDHGLQTVVPTGRMAARPWSSDRGSDRTNGPVTMAVRPWFGRDECPQPRASARSGSPGIVRCPWYPESSHDRCEFGDSPLAGSPIALTCEVGGSPSEPRTHVRWSPLKARRRG